MSAKKRVTHMSLSTYLASKSRGGESGMVRKPVTITQGTVGKSDFWLKTVSLRFLLEVAPVYALNSTGNQQLFRKGWQVIRGIEGDTQRPTGYAWNDSSNTFWATDSYEVETASLNAAMKEEIGWVYAYDAGGYSHSSNILFPNVVKISEDRVWQKDRFGFLKWSDFDNVVVEKGIEISYRVYHLLVSSRVFNQSERITSYMFGGVEDKVTKPLVAQFASEPFSP